MPKNASKYRNTENINIKMSNNIGRETRIIHKENFDKKPTNLFYEPKYETVLKRLDTHIPNL